MPKQRSRTEKSVISKVHAIKGVNREFRALVCGAGPEEDGVGDLYLFLAVLAGVREEVAEVEGDFRRGGGV